MSDEQKKDPGQPSEEAVKPESASPDTASPAAAEAESPKADKPETAEPADAKAAGTESSAEASQPKPEGAAGEAGEAKPAARVPREARVRDTAKAEASAPAAASADKSEAAAPAAEKAAPTDEEKEAKAKAAAEARAARASARAKKPEEDAGPKVPSPLQPRLDEFVKLLKEAMGEDTVQEAFVNERGEHLPCAVIKNESWLETAELLKHHSDLKLDYLRNVTGVDYETHMEVVYHLLSMETKHEYCIKVRTDRSAPSVSSVTPVWPTANWNEREIYDLLGIDFPGHPDLRRIMMSDDWVGHPLRKDYEPLDPEV